ncbi:disintegrin and metalloproteinase domain-containing protein 8-like [Dromiciops gliroides]|uniref:disintegrin and metalloproteinase domain-containing protein 8-like n=1 Tax=Dromiciops gliroides TaxID=33562 RepID=UPI001CC36E8B|nr:disintegrin and metalloproteinase domain-containing protein 8-like [Dromiciops gliroides]
MHPTGPCFWASFLLCLGSTLRECQGFSALPPLPAGHLPHVEQYEVVQPLQLPIPGALNELSPSPTLYPETIRYLLGMRGNNFTLHLRRNRHLVGSDYTETYTSANGTEVTEKPQGGRHCFYQGHVEGHQNSVASISTCRGIQGFFKTGSTIYLIEPLDQKKHQGKHAVYREQDLKENHRTCGVAKVSLKGELETMMAAVSMPHNWIPGSIPKETRYVELFVVVDHTEYKKYKSLKKMRHRVKEIVNHVDRLYQEINFRVVLTGLEIWDKENKAAVDSNVESTLSSFLQWRGSHLITKKQHDNAQLITGVSFEGTVVGLARLASMCTEGSGGVNHDHSKNPLGVATTLAHEMGHNLGMDHDENIMGCQCEKNKRHGGCIMTSTSGEVLPKKFSSCSKYNLQKFLGGNIFSSSCLNNFPVLEKLEGKPVCGNKFLERGEECDCGLPGECLNQCCNPKNCRLAAGAECTEGECCQACQVMPPGEICREAQNACDLAEYCDGKQPKCPENVYKENGTPCWRGYCYNGTCPTYKQQCQALWGLRADVSMDKCFLLSLPKGCTEAFYPSHQGLDKCGFLHCSRPSPMRSTRHLCSFFLEDERCDLAITKNESRDPFVMVAPGTKCGKKKVCQERSCQNLSIYGAKNCSKKCHDRGVCNHKRECHCDPGWAPPDCQRKLSQLRDELLNRSVLVGVLVALTLMAVLAVLVFVLYKWKLGKKGGTMEAPPNYSYNRETTRLQQNSTASLLLAFHVCALASVTPRACKALPISTTEGPSFELQLRAYSRRLIKALERVSPATAGPEGSLSTLREPPRAPWFPWPGLPRPPAVTCHKPSSPGPGAGPSEPRPRPPLLPPLASRPMRHFRTSPQAVLKYPPPWSRTRCACAKSPSAPGLPEYEATLARRAPPLDCLATPLLAPSLPSAL